MNVLDEASLRTEGTSLIGAADVTGLMNRPARGSAGSGEVASTPWPHRRSPRPGLAECTTCSGSSEPDGDHSAPPPGETEAVGIDTVLVAGLLGKLLGTRPAGDWPERALCAEADPELFYPEARETAPEAKSICRVCEVRADCLAAALANREPHGIWGGLTYRERLAFTRDQRRAGPQRRRRRRG